MMIRTLRRTTPRTNRRFVAIGKRRRSAAIVVELICVCPVLIVLLLAVVEFGCIFASMKQVAYASRFGAKKAAEAPRITLSNLNMSGVGTLRNDINRYLRTVGIPKGACRVILEHNACGIANPQQVDDPSSDSCDCSVPSHSTPTTGEYVRVTVCVNLTDACPDLLGAFGFSLDDRVITETTVFRYEPRNMPPNAVVTVPTSNLPLPPGSSLNRMLPVSDTNIRVNVQNSQMNPLTQVTLQFDGLASGDPDEANGLSYQWSTTGTPSGSSTGTGFSAVFPIPSTPGTTSTFFVELTVTDSCSESHSSRIRVQTRLLP